MLTLGNKIIAGSFKSGASWEVGDVGISALGIDESLNKRRYLNGQVISQTQFVQFTAFLKSRVSVYPSLATTEVNWQAAVTNSDLGQCGQFVIDDVAGTIRLPKVVNINGLQDLTGLGGIKAESLPNIKGGLVTINNNGDCSEDGSLTYVSGEGTTGKARVDTVGSTTGGIARIKLDASLSSSTYQDNAPVQQEAVQYPYFIQVAEGIENSVDVSREIELNNPFSLLDYKYSEYELSNTSWLLSNGQWNSGAVYQSVYNLLLQIYNGTVTKAGVSVKLSTETYDDYDFVLNTGDTTFRLPLLNGEEDLPGSTFESITYNGHGSTYTASKNGIWNIYGYGSTAFLWVNNITAGIFNSTQGAASADSTGGCFVPVKKGDIVTAGYYAGTVTRFGIAPAIGNGNLYFYVGETIQDANIIATAGVLTKVANCIDRTVESDRETVVGWGMPDYSAGVSFVSGSTVQVNGWMYYFSFPDADRNTISIDNVNIMTQTPAYYNEHCGLFPVSAGQIVSVNIPENTDFTFYPCKGVN